MKSDWGFWVNTCSVTSKARAMWVILFAGWLLMMGHHAYGTHVRAADIIVKRICGTMTYEIRVIAYMNSLSGTQFGTSSEVFFGDGSSVRIPITPSTQRPDLGLNVRVAEFVTTHTYSSNGRFTITYLERDRSSNVLNILNSHDVPYVTFITIDTNFGCNQFPVLSVVPLDRGCSGITFFHNPGAFDLDGDSLSYELSIPASSATTQATYDDPAAAKFYTDFEHGNEAKTGRPVFKIDSITGLITWDAPGAVGEYNIAFKIFEWRRNPATGVYSLLSTTTRDMQIIVEECQNVAPGLTMPGDLCIVAGEPIEGLILGSDPDNHFVKIELFSEIFLFEASQDPATFSPSPPAFVSSTPPARVTVSWQTSCAHVRQQPYQVVAKITDRPPSGPSLVKFATWTIRVIAPPPEPAPPVLDVERLHAVLSWDNYSCGNASTMQVWRRVGSFDATQSACAIGIVRNGGYALVGEADVADNTFTDTNFGMGLSAAAVYCYRLVALIGDTKSKMSTEICIGPIVRDAPVITHVSVEQTAAQGQTRISWRSPMGINKEQFPEPYRYDVYRAKGFAGDTSILQIGSSTDTTFVDIANNRDGVYNYRIVVYSKPVLSDDFIAVDTSGLASSVRLVATPGISSIRLHWRDSVPWSNVNSNRPYHLIYRGSGILPDNALVLVDSVLVTEHGFTFLDSMLAMDQIYTYKILTRGTYGNPAIALQENFSQTVSRYPINTLKPCAPMTAVSRLDCDEYVLLPNCDQQLFTNTLYWDPDVSPGCRVDIESYRVYAALDRDTTYTLIASMTDTVLIDIGRVSPAMCYRVSAVDANGNEGPKSEPVCNDVCPYFQLPNVFTPNGDGCNDLFTARYDESSDRCTSINPTGCPRFVLSIDLRVYNRWGREVYRYSASDPLGVAIDWNGRDENGGELAAGIYYYTADVLFDAVDKERQHRQLKSWVHLVR